MLDPVRLTSGFLLSFAVAVRVVFCVSVTVVLADVALAGAFPLFFVHPLKIYPLAVSGVAEIFTDVPYLYVHPHDTLLIHVHLFNVSVYVFLWNQK